MYQYYGDRRRFFCQWCTDATVRLQVVHIWQGKAKIITVTQNFRRRPEAVTRHLFFTEDI